MQTRPPNPFADPLAGDTGSDATIRRPLPGAVPYPPQGGQGSFGAAPDWNAPSPGFSPFGGAPRSDPFGQPGAGRDPLDFGLGGPAPFGGAPGSYRSDLGPLAGSIRLGPDSHVEQAFELAALNPLVAVASPLLWLAARLNESLPVDDVAQFRARVMEDVSRFETNAMTRGVAPRLARVARYALCATIDDIILNTAWGGQSDWPAKGLVSTFYQETWGGERFFDLLGQLYAQPEDNLDALELMALCLSIGFVGKYRVGEGGAAHLARLRGELYRTIRRLRGPHERRLSAGFATVDAPYRPPARMIWFWVLSAAAIAALVALYLVLGFFLSWRVDAAAERVAALPPAMPVFVGAPDVPAVPEPFAPEAQTQLQRVQAALGADIASGEVEVVEENGDIVARLLRASFPTGGTAIGETEAPLLRRIAAALNPEPGPITVVGHTDNVPIANPSPTRNNDTLSRDRAASAAAMLQRFLTEPGRVTFLGRGDSAPIASNATAEGRARNRRVEFRIQAEDATP
ncbi:type IVB secretion system protein IcmH/DotU [Aureimonas ureilytica]|uniref:type IVB secretion system protein IcmH/DotU n=1 Tax=Aureimonas ureilytica TaxID=401562 RepID=UPI003CF16C5D